MSTEASAPEVAWETLGQCTHCHGPLCLKGASIKLVHHGRTEAEDRYEQTPAEVCCEKCGMPQQNHPKAREIAAAAGTRPGPAESSYRIEYSTDEADRLRKLISGKAHRIGRLERQLQPAGHPDTKRKK